MKTLKIKLLPLFLFLSLCFTSYAETIKILAIGNSFSEDAIENYLYELGKADDVTLIIGNMYIGGCSLETHWNNANNNNAAYEYRKIVNGVKSNTASTKLETAIADEDWDYITFQQVSQNSGMYSTYFPYLTNLLAYVKSKATNPNVKYALHMTWAYQQNSTHSGFANYNKDQMTMYNSILDAASRAATAENISIIIPSGTAIQNARTSFIGDNLCRDGYHLDYNIGRYTAACTWYEKITGKNVLNNTYAPASLSAKSIEVARKAAHSAVQNPTSITDVIVELEQPTGNFNAWNITTVGHNGLNSGILAFPEKNMTLECWLNIDDASGTNSAGVNIISNRHNGNQGFSVNLANNSATSKEDVRFVFKNTKIDGTSDQAFALFLPRTAFSNQWAHLAFVISSDEQKAYAYLNGELYSVIEDFYTSWVGNRVTDQLWIGRWYTNSPTFYGKMADIRVWNVARTADEIAENYNQRLKGTETGLYVYYNFDNFDQSIINVANPGTNNGSLLPATTWTNMHSYEVLSQKPVNLAIANNQLTWEAEGESWVVEFVETASKTVLLSEVAENTSFSLQNLNLPTASEYFIRVRTFNNDVYSDWASVDVSITGLSGVESEKMTISTEGNRLIVNSEIAQPFDLFAIDGRLVRSVNLIAGRNEINGLAKGFYLAKKQKISIK